MKGRTVWAITAMVGALGATIVGILAITPEDSAGRDIALMLVPILGTLVGGVWLGRTVGKRVDVVQGDVADVRGQVADVRAEVTDARRIPGQERRP